jgi:hypothetical protein
MSATHEGEMASAAKSAKFFMLFPPLYLNFLEFHKLKFVGENVPPAACLLKKAWRKLLQHGFVQTLQ